MFNWKFTCNLSATTLVLTVVSLALAHVHDLPETTTKEQRYVPIESGMKLIGVVRAQQFLSDR
jgi:hypothetical protein